MCVGKNPNWQSQLLVWVVFPFRDEVFEALKARAANNISIVGMTEKDLDTKLT